MKPVKSKSEIKRLKVMEVVKYPRYTRRDDMRCKLTNADIVRIGYLYRVGRSLDTIAKMFDVTESTIRYWTNDNHRQKAIERSARRVLALRRADPKKHNASALKYIHRKEKAMPEFRQYQRKASLKYFYNKKERMSSGK